MDNDFRNTRPSNYVSYLAALVLVAMPFQAFFTTWAGSNFNHLDLIRTWKELLLFFVGLPAIIFLVYKNKDLRSWLKKSWIIRLYVIYIFLHFALGWWAYEHNQVNKTAVIYALLINLRFIAFFVFCALAASKSDFLKKYWKQILLLPATIVVVFGLVQRLFLPYDFLKHFGYSPKTIPAYQTVDANIDYHRVQSTLRGANPLGAYLVLIIPAYFAILNKRRILKYAGLATAGVVLFFSYSRSAWIGTVVSLGLILAWLITNQRRRRQVMVVGIAIFFILVGGIYIFRSSHDVQDTFFHTSSSPMPSVSSNTAHSSAVKHAAADVWHQPLGGGPGTAGPASMRNNHPSRIAENYFLQIGQEVGILGMLLFVAINILVGIELWKLRDQTLPRILLASLVGLTFVNLVSHAWADDTIAYLWWGLAGVALAPRLPAHRQSR